MASLNKLISQRRQKAVLFADISGSSALYKKRGNLVAKSIIDTHLEVLADFITKAKGKVIKTIGDEVMASFDDCARCINAAVVIQNRVAKDLLAQQIQLSIGIGFGEVLADKGDIFGEAVNDAAYLTNLAKGGQILISESFWGHLEPAIQTMAREFDRVKMKGAQQASTIYRVYWQGTEADECETQFMSGEMVNAQLNLANLTIEFQGESNTISQAQTPFVIGRDANKCDLIVEGSQVSREHCKIDFKRGKFVLVDHSTNGCYLVPFGKEEFYIRREEYPLLDSIQLSLGVSAKDAGQESILLYY